MVYLIDTNVIIRFLVGDNEEHFKIAVDIFDKIENGQIKAEILEPVLIEAYFVLIKFYKLPKDEVIEDLKKIMALKGIIGDKILLLETLNNLLSKNIDFADALICAKSKLYVYSKLSFDNDLKKC